MKTTRFLALLLLATPIAASAQTKPTTKPTTTTTTTTPATTPAGTQQQIEVTEDLDPETGKVIRRTTRTINVPVGTATSPSSTAGSSSTMDAPATSATDAQVTTFLRRKTTVSTLTTTGLLAAYELFMERVRNDRQNWQPSNWATAANIMSSLNDRYQQLRGSFSLDDKLTIRAQQAEFQALRTAKQISTQVSDKL